MLKKESRIYAGSGVSQTPNCVQVDSKELGKLRGAGAVKAVSEDMEDFFELVDESMYTETMGLNLEIDSGIAMFS